MMYRLGIKWILGASGLLLLLGCGSAPVNSYYTLENTDPAPGAKKGAPLCHGTMAVESVFVYPPYDLTKIVFRPDDLEIRYYTHSHWGTTPEEMMRKLIIRRLDNANLFEQVDHVIFIMEPDFKLYAKLYNLEEIDKERGWNGRLAMSFELRDDATGESVWEYRFDETRPVDEKDVKAVVHAINAVYNRHIDRATQGLKQFLSGYHRCREGSAASE